MGTSPQIFLALLVTMMSFPFLGAGCSSPTPGVDESPRAASDTWRYPLAPKGDVYDEYHGTQVADPYRWLEQPDSAATRAWVAAQNQLSSGFLGSLPGREAIRQRLVELWGTERFSLPVVRGERRFYRYNPGPLEQSVLLVADGPDATGRLLLDPNTFSEDGSVSLSGFEPSPDGALLAYALSDGGSDWDHWYFMDVESGELLQDEITHSKFSGVDWMENNTGVVYSRFQRSADEIELHGLSTSNEVCLHLMGTPQSEDIVLVEAGSNNIMHWPRVTQSRRAVVITHGDSVSDNNEVEVLSLVGNGRGRGLPIISGFDAQYEYIGNDGDELWFLTDQGAPNRRVVGINLFESDRERWRELVPERDVALEAGYAVGGHLVLSYLRKAHSEVRVHSPDGQLVRTQELPGMATVGGFGGQWTDPRTYFFYTDFTTPPEIWSLDVASGATQIEHRPQIELDRSAFVTKQVFYTSKDGTPISMFLVHARGVELDGQLPTYLYGYGGFEISLTPSYSAKWLTWLERGGLLAVANLRGGGEYGGAWHEAGIKLNKQTVFDDFIAAAEWLIEEGYTRPERLAIAGGSNGGLLVGACLSQRPELFAAALPAAGVMDMLRYQNFTIGWSWATDYGTSEDPDEFAALYAYSPLHNLRDGESYPATLVMTGDHDDRVVPAHSYKFTARLQEASAGQAPAMIRIETRVGHGAGRSTSMSIAQATDELLFLEYALGVGVLSADG